MFIYYGHESSAELLISYGAPASATALAARFACCAFIHPPRPRRPPALTPLLYVNVCTTFQGSCQSPTRWTTCLCTTAFRRGGCPSLRTRGMMGSLSRGYRPPLTLTPALALVAALTRPAMARVRPSAPGPPGRRPLGRGLLPRGDPRAPHGPLVDRGRARPAGGARAARGGGAERGGVGARAGVPTGCAREPGRAAVAAAGAHEGVTGRGLQGGGGAARELRAGMG